MRQNAVKVLVIYERLEFFFDIFKNEKTIGVEVGEKMKSEWLHGNLNGQISEKLCTLPERFGQLIFDETEKLMMVRTGKGKEGGRGKGKGKV
jgi:hypothetical protein